MKEIVVLTVLFLISSIVWTLIVNPGSLNPEKNSIINFILGAIMSSFTTIVNSYFKLSDSPKLDESKEEIVTPKPLQS